MSSRPTGDRRWRRSRSEAASRCGVIAGCWTGSAAGPPAPTARAPSARRAAQESDEHERGWAPGVREFFQRELGSGEFPRLRELLGDDADAAVERVAAVFFGAARRAGGPRRARRWGRG